jgi:Cd2+/Zn2+-exporting ATPase
LVAIVPPLLFDQPFWAPGNPAAGWLYRALGLLVVACPCALVISTPVTVISAITNAARHGVLIKGGIYLETLSRVRAIAFDKTGTLTRGLPTVVRVKSLNCVNEADGRCENCDDLLALALAVEQHSEHPLARAIVDASADRGVGTLYPPADGVRAMTGRGVVGRVAEQDVMIGSHRHFDEYVPHEFDDCRALQDAAANGQTGLLISADDQYLGYITVADSVRNDSRQVLAELREIGVPNLVMLTGDDARTAHAIAAEVGLADVRAGLLPEDKVTAVTALRDEYGYTAMVGDGINDAPALAAADVGIAMGAAGTAQALETADIALMSDDLTKLPFAVRLARAGMRTIRINVGFSLGLKALFLAAMLAGVGTMWMAVLADVGATLIVTLYGMRMLTRPKPAALPAT